MAKKGVLTWILAILGTILVWLPLLAPLIFGLILLVASRIFRLDYLMPGELFLMVIGGALALLWASLRAHSLVKWVTWTSVSVVVLLVVSQGVAVVTGLANGSVPPGGWQQTVVMILFAGYIAAVILLGVVAIRLLLVLGRRTI